MSAPDTPTEEADELAPPPNAASDEETSRHAPWWDAGGKALSAAYWGAITLLICALFRTTILPFVDYPQHLALAAILRRMLMPGAPERELFATNLLSYNSLFQVLVAGANLVLPIDAAGKVVLGLYIVLLGIASLNLLRATGRPRARAFLILPVVFGYSIAWGFVNFGLGVAIHLLVLARVLERRAEPPPLPKWLVRFTGDHRRLVRDVVTALLALAGAYTHLLATALLYMLMLAAIVVDVQTERAPLGLRLGRAVRTGLPLLPAVAYCAWVYERQQTLVPQNYEYGAYEGNDVFALAKVKGFFEYATGLRADGLDAKILGMALGLLVIGAILRDLDDAPPPHLRWLLVASVFAYLALPHVFWATNFVFERITFLVVVTAVLWAPRALPRYEAGLRLLYVSVGLAAAGSFFAIMGTVRGEVADLDAILDEAPKGRRVTGLVWYPKIPSTAQWSLLQSPAYYVARNGGEVAFSFTRTMSLPVHYRFEKMPPDTPPNFEWNPSHYDPRAPYAEYFDLVLMKTTDDDGVDPRASVWGAQSELVDVVAHRGRWWIFETGRLRGVPRSARAGPGDPEDAEK